MDKVAEWRWQWKEAVNLKMYQYKLYNLNKETIDEKNKQNFRSLWDNTQSANTYVMGVPEERRKSAVH